MSWIDVRVGDGGIQDAGGERASKENAESEAKKFLGVKFACANDMYTRMYKNKDGSAYVGRCPKCMRAVRIGISKSGVNTRFFIYDCGLQL